jgi:hypothetical protein
MRRIALSAIRGYRCGPDIWDCSRASRRRAERWRYDCCSLRARRIAERKKKQ